MSSIGLGPGVRPDDCGFLGVIAGTDIEARCQLLAHRPGTTHRTWCLDRMEGNPMVIADEPEIGEARQTVRRAHADGG